MTPEATFCRRAVVVEAWARLLAIVTLGLASAYAAQLVKAPVRSHVSSKTAYAVFFCGTTPLASILASTGSIVLYKRNKVTPLYGVIISTIFFFGWTVTMSLWMHCHYFNLQPNDLESADFCYQARILSVNDYLEGVGNALADSLTGFSIPLIFLYFGYMCYASATFNKLRMIKPRPAATPENYEMPVRKPAGSSAQDAAP
ncbi:hypothetical protein H2201_002398 [Coniosporium apollinis]|uniref:MARVEL domain-containing protein n=2 Tax=Coniosporium TaxID=2810619 RepID=A0ABQ9NYS0_9PEZI|nr:hypothetical protein H2199_001837 [Cladosporium sp. JES 115]KAJ9667529.1 hypothetical protein H2201_002398 [Coniosporium apollinis]